MTTETLPIVSDDPAVQAFYEKCRHNGQSHNGAEMFAFRQPPGASDDTTYLRGVGTLRQQCGDDDKEVDRVVSAAKKLGYTPNASDLYNPTLARRLGDPLAFVPAANPKAHVLKVCKMRRKACTGLVNYTPPEREPRKKTTRLHPKLVARHMQRAIAEDPGLTTRKGAIAAKREQIVNDHGFSLDDKA